jgi:hypothetical protein
MGEGIQFTISAKPDVFMYLLSGSGGPNY